MTEIHEMISTKSFTTREKIIKNYQGQAQDARTHRFNLRFSHSMHKGVLTSLLLRRLMLVQDGQLGREG